MIKKVEMDNNVTWYITKFFYGITLILALNLHKLDSFKIKYILSHSFI